MADLAVLLLQDTVLDLLVYPWDRRDQALLEEGLQEPMHPGEEGGGRQQGFVCVYDGFGGFRVPAFGSGWAEQESIAA